MKAPVAFVDTETLGLDADRHPVWEVALIEPDGVEHLWQVNVTPAQVWAAEPIALEMTGFADRYGVERQPITRADMSFRLERIIEPGTHLAGAVVSFDEERLRRMLLAEGFTPRWHYHLIDVEALAIGFLSGREAAAVVQPPWKSDELTAALGITVPEESKHTALGDARWAKAIYDAVMS